MFGPSLFVYYYLKVLILPSKRHCLLLVVLFSFAVQQCQEDGSSTKQRCATLAVSSQQLVFA